MTGQEDQQPMTGAEVKAGFAGMLLGVALVAAFGVWLYWSLDSGKPREQRARELQEWTERHAAEEATRRRNETVYEELIRRTAP